MKSFLVSLCISFCCLVTGFAQDNETIDALILDAKYAEAVEVLEKTLRQTTDPGNQIVLENKKAEVLIKLGKLDAADDLVNAMEKEIAKSTSLSFAKPMVQTTKGLLYLNRGRNDLALETFQNAMSEFEQQHKSSSLEAAQTLSYLGITYINTGKYTQAEEQLHEALMLRQKQLPASHELIAASYNDLGLIFSFQGDNDKALDFYDKALVTYKQLHGNDHPKIAIANTNIGIAYRNLELYGDAINDFETALKIWEKIYPGAHPLKGFVLSNLAQTYLKMGDVKAALGFYDRALNIMTESYGKKHPDIAGILNAIGSIKVSTNNYDEALQYYQQALKANVNSFNTDDINANPPLEGYYNGNTLLYSLLFKAEALEAKYFGRSLKFKDLLTALQSLHTCDTLIDQLRKQITNERDKIALGVIANEVYAGGVRIAYNTGMNAVSKKKYFEDAFYFAEKSKSAVLLEAIADTEAKSFAGIPPTLVEEEKNLKSAIALCTQKLAQKPDPEEEKYLRETSFNLNRGYETFIKKLENEFPQYFNLKFNTASPSTKDLQSISTHDAALISYFSDDKNKRLYIFVVQKNKFKIIDHSLPGDFDKYITGLRNSLFFNDQKTFNTTSAKLYDLLIPKLPGNVKHLIILPTGRLSILPFEALLSGHVKPATSYQHLPYLLKDYSIRYEFSAGLMLQKAKHKQTQNVPSILLCAPVSFPEKDNLNELPGTASEVEGISNLFQAKKINKSLYLKEEANEQLIKSGALKNVDLIHFATHGIVDEKNPELSRIFLQEAAAEDGNLFAGEIYNLELNANLVTLSACQTGLGKISKGEGVIGLSRALTYAGAKNVIVSFWSVADESTSILMRNFYENLLRGNMPYDFSTNLRAAKLKLMENTQYGAPYYWAPFILIGN